MSMSTYVEGLRPADERWRQMKAIWDACTAAAIEAPEEVQEFFDWRTPDQKGVVVKIDEAASQWRDADRTAQGLEVDVTKLPRDVTVIRFVNSW